MQPLVISIPGDFWDVQIYRGRLYLWSYDGRLSVYDWERLIEIAYPYASRSLLIKAAWLRGNTLYNPDIRTVMEDPAFNDCFKSEYDIIANSPPIVTQKTLRESLFGEQDNPVRELPTDTEIFKNTLYLVTYDGLWSTTAHRSNQRYPVSSKPKKCLDAQLYSATASHGRLALSAGDDGLFEYDLRGQFTDDFNNRGSYKRSMHTSDVSLKQLTKHHSSYADWAFASVYSTSLVSGSYLLAFDWKRDSADKEKLRRVFISEINGADIIEKGDKTSLSWGGGDKICGLFDEELRIFKFVQRSVSETKNDVTEAFDSLGTIRLSTKHNVVKTGLAYFGVLIETENKLLVYRSDNDIWSINGPLVRWRTYPRAHFYENQLHVVTQDAVHIVSFMHDYWQNQREKIAGISYR